MMTLEFWKLIIALGLGIAIGLERTHAHKTAGMRTYGLVSLGSCLFVLLSQGVVTQGLVGFDPMRIAASVVMGIGFLCGGVIILQNNQLTGLTTAAGIWLTAGVGMAVGFGLISLALFATSLTLVVLTALWFVERYVAKATDQPRH
jgi:putative Mg2+ transporter-C (MgtC) family protein